MTTEINTLADIKTWQERMGKSGPPMSSMQAELSDLRAYAEKQEAEMLALLDRLEELTHKLWCAEVNADGYKEHIAELEAEIAASQQGSEPVAWMRKNIPHPKLKDVTLNKVLESDVPLYTHPIADKDVLDAERYRFIRSGRIYIEPNENEIYVAVERGVYCKTAEQFDSEVDAAIAAAQEKDNG